MSLSIRDKHPTLDAYYFRGAYVPYAIIAVEKRFSDAELAAEYWAAMEELSSKKLTSQTARIREQIATLRRFAQHADISEVI